MTRSGTFLCACLVVCALHASSAQATVRVYTDRSVWQAAVLAQPFDHFHEQDFEFGWTGGLDPGLHFFFPLLIEIPGGPGFNAIDDALTADPFADALSPNGSAYYLGDAGVEATQAARLSIPELDFVVTGFGADWVVQGDLTLEIQGTSIPFDAYLPTRRGFLGILTDRPQSPLTITLSGSAVFGLDDFRTANVPSVAPAWLLGVALLGLATRPRQATEPGTMAGC